MILITDVVGMDEINDKFYLIIDRTDTNITLELDSSGFTVYESGGIGTLVAITNQFAEIEMHGMILEVSGSQMLS